MQLSFVPSASLISMLLEDWNNNVKCYTSQLKYVFWLEEKVSSAVGQNSLSPLGRTKLTNSLRRTKLTNSLGKQQLELSTRTWSGCAPCNPGKFICQPTSGKQFFSLFLLSFWSWEVYKTLHDWPSGKQWVLFPLDLNVLLDFANLVPRVSHLTTP